MVVARRGGFRSRRRGRHENRLLLGKPVGGIRPAAPRAVRQPLMSGSVRVRPVSPPIAQLSPSAKVRSEEHTSELQSLMRISYAVFCLKKKKKKQQKTNKAL